MPDPRAGGRCPEASWPAWPSTEPLHDGAHPALSASLQSNPRELHLLLGMVVQPSCSPGNGQGRWEQPHREGAHCSEESPKSFLLSLSAPCSNTFWDTPVSQMAPKTSQRVHQGVKHSSLCSPSSGILLPLPWHSHFSTCQKQKSTSLQMSHDGAGAQQSQLGSLELGIPIQNREENPVIPQACMPGRGQDASLLLFPLNELPEFMSWNPTHHPRTASGVTAAFKGLL